MTGCDDAMMVPSKQEMNCEASRVRKMAQKRRVDVFPKNGEDGPDGTEREVDAVRCRIRGDVSVL